jgi:hypothetical protein
VNRLAVSTLSAGVLLIAGAPALALPSIGATPPDFVVQDLDDKPLKLSSLRGKPVLVFHEDKDAIDQNATFKSRLSLFVKANSLGAKVSFLPVADVAAWSFWPAKGIVKGELRSAAQKAGTALYADWTAQARQKLGAVSGQSNVVLLDRTGNVLWASSGALSTQKQDKLLDILKAAAGP